MHNLSAARLAMAKEWLDVTAPVDALQASVLRNDAARLVQFFEQSPDARRWELMRRQRAAGVPEELLGYQIDDTPSVNVAIRGTVRHVGKNAWIEPDDRPGVVIPIRNPHHLKTGQKIRISDDGRIQLQHPTPSFQPR